MDTILKNKQGQYKDFDCLLVACKMKKIEGKVLQAIQQASIISGLKDIKASEQRKIMYKNLKWLQVIKLVELLKFTK
jgi:hypothetical protein